MIQASKEEVVSVHAALTTTSILSKGKDSSSYSSETNRRKTVGLTIRQDLLSIARDNQVNLSKLLESSLIQLLDPQNTPFSLSEGSLFAKEKVLAGGVGFGPTTTGLGGLRHYPLDFVQVEADFQAWLQSRNLSDDYYEGILSSLRRFGSPVRQPIDVAKMFQKLSPGQRHGLIRAVRNLFNFYEAQGYADKSWLDLLRKNIPQDETGFDINVPAETQIVNSLRQLSSDAGHQAHFALYNLILDSGIRVIEAVKLAENLKETPIERVGDFYVATLGMMRKMKVAYYAFFTEYTMGLLQQLEWTIGYETARKLKAKAGRNLVSYKYLRKFANDTMTDEKLNIPESVADFIQGRVPKSVGAKHYMQLRRKATKFYPRYARYLQQLRRKVS